MFLKPVRLKRASGRPGADDVDEQMGVWDAVSFGGPNLVLETSFTISTCLAISACSQFMPQFDW